MSPQDGGADGRGRSGAPQVPGGGRGTPSHGTDDARRGPAPGADRFGRPGDRPVGLPCATRSPVMARHAMVCASQPLAAQIGLDVLRQGGTAVDAAIATNAALGLMEPTMCGIGGDLFALVWEPSRERLVGFNGSGRAPRGMGLDELRAALRSRGSRQIPPTDALSVSVPGCVDGWFALHERFGRLPMDTLLAPVIAYAREGFAVSPVIAGDWQRARAVHADAPGFATTFLPAGRAPRAGEVFRNPDLARTYERLVREGRDGFYRGPVAEALVRRVCEAGGALGTDDLARHAPDWVAPVSVPYRGHELWELPPNGQGIAALQMLRILEGWPLQPADPRTWHRMIETKKLVYEDRARHYADPDHHPLPIERLLSSEYADERRALVDDDVAATRVPAGDAGLRSGDTVYLAAADDEGCLVSWIQSNYMGFGTGLVPEGTGFSLQNRGCLFHLADGHANVYAPGKRPFHTIIPAMLTRQGQPVLCFGVMGGAMQPQGHVQIVTRWLDFEMDVQEAGDAPRWRHDGSSEPTGETMTDGGTVFLERGVPDDVVRGLAGRGHRIVVEAGGFGGYQAIEVTRPDGARVYQGASESRKDGSAVGF